MHKAEASSIFLQWKFNIHILLLQQFVFVHQLVFGDSFSSIWVIVVMTQTSCQTRLLSQLVRAQSTSLWFSPSVFNYLVIELFTYKAFYFIKWIIYSSHLMSSPQGCHPPRRLESVNWNRLWDDKSFVWVRVMCSCARGIFRVWVHNTPTVQQTWQVFWRHRSHQTPKAGLFQR